MIMNHGLTPHIGGLGGGGGNHLAASKIKKGNNH